MGACPWSDAHISLRAQADLKVIPLPYEMQWFMCNSALSLVRTPVSVCEMSITLFIYFFTSLYKGHCDQQVPNAFVYVLVELEL